MEERKPKRRYRPKFLTRLAINLALEALRLQQKLKSLEGRLAREQSSEPGTSSAGPFTLPLVIEVTVFPRVNPPKNAELFLSSLLRGDERDAAVGDLVERYQKIYQRLGKLRADLWFWGEVLWSLGPLLKRLIVSGGLVVLAQWLKKLIS
jgi:hypothetical protein